jgi:hypothetical protein
MTPIQTAAGRETYQSLTTPLAFHTDQLKAMEIFIAPPNHKALDRRALLRLSHPPAIPPMRNVMTAPTLRFLLTFFFKGASSFGSEARSQYTLVNTVVGTSLNPSNRDVTICPPDWKAKRASGTNSMNETVEPVSVTTPSGCGTTPPETNAAATNMRRP